MNVLITGARGMLGQAMVNEFMVKGWNVLATDHSTLDITDFPAVRAAVAAQRPELVVNCAAYTAVDKAETEPGPAFAVNALGPRNLALACLESGCALLHISTDYVFDGEKGEPYEVWDSPNPLNIYGKSKLWGENYVRSLTARHYLVRTSWLFGPGGKNFVSAMLNLAANKAPLRVVDDQLGCPTYTLDLARACSSLVETGAFGIYHVTNQGSTTWFKFAVEVFRQAGLQVDVVPIRTGELLRPARRPMNSCLDSFPLRETVGYLLPAWQDALSRFLLYLKA